MRGRISLFLFERHLFSVIILLLFGLLGRYLVVLKRETKIIQILVRKNQLNLDTFDSVEKKTKLGI